MFCRLIRADAAWSTASWAAQPSVRANWSALWIAIAAWVATATANSTSACVHGRGRAVNAARAPITFSSLTRGTEMDDLTSRIPPYSARSSSPLPDPSSTIGRRSRTSWPNQPSSGPRTGSRATVSSSRPAEATTTARSSSRIRIVVPSVSRARFTSVTIVRRIASRSSVVVSRSAIPRTACSRSVRSCSWAAWPARDCAARTRAARRASAATTRTTSSATIAASITDHAARSSAIGTRVTRIVPRPTIAAVRGVRNAAAKKSGTDARPTPSGSWAPTRSRTTQ